MASFYGGPTIVNTDTISDALGYIPTLYTLIKDSNDVLILQPIESSKIINNNGTFFSLNIINNIPTLIV